MVATAWHALSAEEVAERLRVDARVGLSVEEAQERLRLHGPNRLPELPGRSAWGMFFAQFASLLVAVLAVAAALAWVTGEVADAVAIAAILLLNAVLGFVQERGAAQALASLRRLSAPTARVRRAGAVGVVPAAELVVGDVIELSAGDAVPADVRLQSAAALRAVEAALTGEPEPVSKEASASVPIGADLAERATLLHQGTSVAAGEAVAIVVATGAATELGHIAMLVEREPEQATPLQVRLESFGRWLIVGAAAAVALVFLLGLWRGHAVEAMLRTSVSLAVAAVPEGLPAVVTVALALGVARMARRGALVRRLAAVETLGSTSVICTDKTGTLTVGTMRVCALVTLEDGSEDEVEVQGTGVARPTGFHRRADLQPIELRAAHEALLHAAAGASTARLAPPGAAVQVLGDPMEGALLAAALAVGVDSEGLDAREPVLALVPFDAERKRMAVVRVLGAAARSHVKGAPEALFARAARVLVGGVERPITPVDLARLEAANLRQAALGRRLLAVARADAPRGVFAGDGGTRDPEQALTLLGLVAFVDPPRPAAAAAVAACRRAGITVVMITGDQPATALAVARDLGLAEAQAQLAHGRDVASWDDAALAERVPALRVYARTSPEQKLRIVRAWQAGGAVVAMTGDGVNDAPALKGADIGVAMGLSGTDVAKDASAMVLLDDEFATLVAAVAEGRRIYDNVRKCLLYLLSGNAGEVLVMAVGVLVGLPLPLLPLQLLWINLVTDGLPALALAADPADDGVLERPPRRPDQPLADRAFLGVLSASALLTAAVTLGVFVAALEVGEDVTLARSLAFSTLVVEELMRAFVFRSRTRIVWEVGLFSNSRLLFVVLLTFGLQLLVQHVEPIARLLGAVPLSWPQTVLVGLLGAVPATILERAKLLRRGLARRGAGGAEMTRD